ncbi:MAG: hypothetical protein CL663_03190 [Bacteroidetes bacterium]|nr:hypothetical protein [Bacteroidota bacterium]|tara:strand:+ start:710 stop:1546 length:837 start_codon:yes stop_codon:yes gene_type:complete
MSTDTTQFFSNDSIPITDSLNFLPVDSLSMELLSSDSVATQIDSTVIEIIPEPVQLYSANKISKGNEQWVGLILLLGFIILAFVNFNHSRRFSQMFKAVFTKNHLNQMIREGNFFKEQSAVLLLLNFGLSAGLSIYFATDLLFPMSGFTRNPEFFGYFLIFIAALWILKLFIIKTNSIIFKTPKPAYEIALYIFISNLLSGVIILPLITIYYYSGISAFLFIAFICYLALYIIRLVREYMIGSAYSIFSVLHLFLYLCCLEIIPLVIVIKIVSIYYNG